MITSFDRIRLHSGILDVSGDNLYLNSIRIGANPLAQGNVSLAAGAEEYRISFGGTYTEAPTTVIGELLIESGNPLYSYDIYNIDRSGFSVAFSDALAENVSFLYHVLPSGVQNEFVGTGSHGGGGGITGSYVKTFNGQTGDVIGVSSVNGLTGNVTISAGESSAGSDIYLYNNFF